MIDELDAFVALGIVMGIAILILGIFAWERHRYTHRKLEELRQDLQGGMESLHNRSDRELAERAWSLQGIRSALEVIRLHLVSMFKKNP